MEEEQSMLQISLRVILGVIFIWAGTMKVLDLDSFVETVAYFKIAPFDVAPWDMWLGYMLPTFEIIVGAMLIFGILLKGAIISVTALSVAFLVAVVSVHSRGLNIECGCFGKALSFKNYYLHISVLGIMVLMSLLLIAQEMRSSRDQNKLA